VIHQIAVRRVEIGPQIPERVVGNVDIAVDEHSVSSALAS
jgi:hypothetical protein